MVREKGEHGGEQAASYSFPPIFLLHGNNKGRGIVVNVALVVHDPYPYCAHDSILRFSHKNMIVLLFSQVLYINL